MPEKQLFGKTIKLNNESVDDIYSDDISLMFDWMKCLKLNKNPTILDVGANIGMFSLSYASIFNEAEIHSFEPVSFIYNDLCQNLKINPNLSKNIHPHNFGFSNCVEKKQLSIPVPKQHERYDNNIDNRLFSVFGQGEEKFEAEFLPIDLWIDECKINAVDFIKIDVEGYEYSVLEGSVKTLDLFKPIVMFELNKLTVALSNRTADEYLKFGNDHGYKVFGLEYGYKSKLLEINKIEQVDLISDIILLPS